MTEKNCPSLSGDEDDGEVYFKDLVIDCGVPRWEAGRRKVNELYGHVNRWTLDGRPRGGWERLQRLVRFARHTWDDDYFPQLAEVAEYVNGGPREP